MRTFVVGGVGCCHHMQVCLTCARPTARCQVDGINFSEKCKERKKNKGRK